jgi:hypothetical protein
MRAKIKGSIWSFSERLNLLNGDQTCGGGVAVNHFSPKFHHPSMCFCRCKKEYWPTTGWGVNQQHPYWWYTFTFLSDDAS